MGLTIKSAGIYAGSGTLGLLAKGLKYGNPDAIREAAVLLSRLISKECAIAPMPSHFGRATYMLEVAREMERMGYTVEDCLASSEHSSLFHAKKKGLTPDVEMRLLYKRRSDSPLYVIDNVISSGCTMLAAAAAGADRFAFVSSIHSYQ